MGVNGTNGRLGTNGRHAPSAGHAELPSHDRDAERALLGSMLRDPSLIPAIVQLVRTEDFYVYAHQCIYLAFVELHTNGQDVDIVTLSGKITDAKQSDDVGGLPYLVGLYDAAPCAAHYQQYAERITVHAKRRQLVHALREIEADAADRGEPIAAVLTRAALAVGQIAERDRSRSYSRRPRCRPDRRADPGAGADLLVRSCCATRLNASAGH